MVNPIDIHTLTLEELSGVISLYPWYGGARMELCRRMAGLGALSESQIAETALHLEKRTVLSSLLRAGRSVDLSDKDARRLMDAFMPGTASAGAPQRRIRAAGGDYFSQEQYESVRREGDAVFPSFAIPYPTEGGRGERPAESEGFYTETLAGIYLEQGYPDEAADIYLKLSLRYPEKSVYFAALIEEINKKDNRL